ncbi:MAG TPA: HEAT repeat domain-containing protein [Pirellulales bacterium]|nr:HEAT repeat domain-containing protein [Pirellulales bacterium]
MHDEDTIDRGWARWFTPAAAVMIGVAAITFGWSYNRAPLGPATRGPVQNARILRDPAQSDTTRRLAADALEHAPTSIVPELVAELQQGDALGRTLAALCLGRLGTKAQGAADALTAALDDADPRVRQQAFAALIKISPQPQAVIAAVSVSLRDADPKVRSLAFASLRRLGAAGADFLTDLLGDSDADVRRRAAIALGRMGREADAAQDALRAAMKDVNGYVRAAAYAALAKRSAVTAEELAQAVGDGHRAVRATTAELLKRMGRNADPALPKLIALLASDDPAIARKAAEALGDLKITSNEAVAGLIKLLDSSDEETRREAVFALRRLGPAARPAVPALLALLGDMRDSQIGWSALQALPRLGLEAEFRPPELFEKLAAEADQVRSLVLEDPLGRYHLTDENLTLISDENLALIGRLPNLELLNLSGTSIDDAGLAHLVNLKQLAHLQLNNTKITSAGLVHLAGMEQLRSLSLDHCAITDDGLKHLGNLMALERLSLRHTQISDAGLTHLAGLARLKYLSLYDTQITSQGLVQLVHHWPRLLHLSHNCKSVTDGDLEELVWRLPRLRDLWFDGAAVTDAGLAQIAKLQDLESLNIRHTAITDASLKRLAGLPALREIWFDKGSFSDDAQKKLLATLPAWQEAHKPRQFIEGQENGQALVGLSDDPLAD